MIGKLHDRVGVHFIEDEIAKHLKHKYLEWDFAVNKTFGTFAETSTLSSLSHSGQASKVGWWWFFLGQKLRVDSLILTAPNEPLSVPMEIHFTVRLAMASNRNQCRTFHSWRTVRGPSKVQWHSGNGLHTLDERNLGKRTDEDKEKYLFWRWFNPALFQLPKKDRGDFAAVKFPGSEERLEAFAGFLEKHMQFDAPDGDALAQTKMYPSRG